jgi:hypothetical protein
MISVLETYKTTLF